MLAGQLLPCVSQALVGTVLPPRWVLCCWRLCNQGPPPYVVFPLSLLLQPPTPSWPSPPKGTLCHNITAMMFIVTCAHILSAMSFVVLPLPSSWLPDHDSRWMFRSAQVHSDAPIPATSGPCYSVVVSWAGRASHEHCEQCQNKACVPVLTYCPHFLSEQYTGKVGGLLSAFKGALWMVTACPVNRHDPVLLAFVYVIMEALWEGESSGNNVVSLLLIRLY